MTNQILKQKKEELWEESKRITSLFKVYKNMVQKEYKLVKFNQPCVFLLRNANKVEFYEASKGNKLGSYQLRYKHSNGDRRTITYPESYIYSGDYGKDQFKILIHHEDWRFPFIANKPIIEYKAIQDAIAHTFSAEMKWQTEAKKQNVNMLWALAGIIIAIGGAIGLYYLFKKEAPPPQMIITSGENISSIIKSGITMVK